MRSLAALGLAAGLGVAIALTWIFSAPLARRLRAIDERARRYAEGDLSRSIPDYGQDEIGSVARMLDSLTHDLANRLAGLEADRARMAAILSGMIEGVLVVNEHGRLQLANEAARRMLHIDDAVEGRHYPEIVRQPAVAGQIEAALAGRPTESVELTGLRDEAMTLIARTAPVDVSPGRGAVVVLHDITDLRRADRIRRDFVANVSHELRTPLTAIRGYVEALADATPEESRRFLEIVSRHTLRMERLVRDLLRLARLDAGPGSPRARPVLGRGAVHRGGRGSRGPAGVAPADRRARRRAGRRHRVGRSREAAGCAPQPARERDQPRAGRRPHRHASRVGAGDRTSSSPSRTRVPASRRTT